MATEGRTLSFRADGDTAEAVEEYREQSDHDTLSDAQQELVRVGLKEIQSPLLYRARERTLDASWHLTLTGIVVAAVGGATNILSAGRGLTLALVLVTTAVGAVAAVELLRSVRGQTLAGQVGGES